LKFRIFTKSQNPEILEATDKSRRFTADEHATMVRQVYSGQVTSREALVRLFLSTNSSKLVTLAYLIRFAYRHDARKILSLGAGMCVIEELLLQALPEGSVVAAADFNSYLIDTARQFFPDLIAVQFDFFRDDVKTICDAAGTTFDIAVFMGSSYVMDDEEHIRLLSQLKNNNVRMVIDLTPTLVPYSMLPRVILGEIKCSLTGKDRGKFHGFQRTRNDFRALYQRADWTLREETTIGDYNYVAVLENR
jgi:hypothetical protein